MAKRDTGVGSTTASQAAAITEAYLTQLRDIHATRANSPETSYYPALSELFNAVGKLLKPKVHCVMNLKNSGAGMPDGGLFTADQLGRGGQIDPKDTPLPARGAVEAKPADKDVKAIAASEQVRNYLDLFGIVIVTNLRSFLIVEQGPGKKTVERESFSLADAPGDFWRTKVAHPQVTAQQRGMQFIEFIKRACLHNAPLINPKDVAWFLASYAKDGLARVEQQKELAALQMVRSALEEALGMKFSQEKGEHFFRSTLVQTLFYGVFSAWVLWCRENPGPNGRFDWRKAEWSLHVPFIRTLYEEIAKASSLGQLHLIEVLDWAGNVLNRVDQDEFFKRFADEHAVQYFYEPFLEAYDPELRKELGVWYTPPEIVKYQVARVDTVLREELDLPDGLADPNVIVLDPCCGTGAYLVEVLRSIERTLREKHDDALIGHDIKTAAMARVFGFEILPAPFVIAHLQIGLLLQETGLPLSVARSERVGVYLTNALTGWEAKGQRPIPHPELEEERRSAGRVKREEKIIVVLGNPPYNAFDGTSPEEEEGLVEVYKGAYEVPKKRRGTRPAVKGKIRYDQNGNPIPEKNTVTRYRLNDPPELGGWGIKKFNLDDLYIRFFRLAEHRIAEMTGKGVISFISNFSYLGDPSFVVMRERMLAEFDKLWIDCMNGDSRETGKLTPNGEPDPSVFSTEYNREGIRVGTAVCVAVRRNTERKKPTVRFRQFWGVNKRMDLLDSLKKKRFDATYALARPSRENRLSFRPENVAEDYESWPKIVDFCAVSPSNGLMEKRGGALIDVDRQALAVRMRDYLDAQVSWEEYKARQTALTEDAGRFVAQDARRKAIKAESFKDDRLRRYALRPFDTRWCYYTPVRPVWNEPRPSLWAQCWEDNQFMIARFRTSSDREGVPVSFTCALLDDHYIMPDAVAIPVLLLNGDRLSKHDHATLFDSLGDAPSDRKPTANLSKPTRTYLASLGIDDPDQDMCTAGMVWMNALAISYSPAFVRDNEDGIRRDWPRIPLPRTNKALKSSAALGEMVANLLNGEADVPSVTGGRITEAMKSIARMSNIRTSDSNPSSADLGVTAGWGHGGGDGVTMPGKGKVLDRTYDKEEMEAIEAEAKTRGMSVKEVVRLLGAKTCDVYLNDTAYWRNIPVNVWEYRIGGYQVIKKWLSYREERLLGRAITPAEAREVTNMARRIAAIILLQPKLDENYRAIKESCFDWASVQQG